MPKIYKPYISIAGIGSVIIAIFIATVYLFYIPISDSLKPVFYRDDGKTQNISIIDSDNKTAYIQRVKEGDMVLAHITARYADTGEIFFTTMRNVAIENNIYDPAFQYKPIAFIVGKHRVIKGIEKAVLDMIKGEEKTVILPPELAYGRYNPKAIYHVPRRYLENQSVAIKVGMTVLVNNFPAKIINISEENVTLDFNHELAGKTLIYTIKILDIKPAEKINKE